jgi:hypothetical protein
MFEFAGKLIAKGIYEVTFQRIQLKNFHILKFLFFKGQIVNAQFAPFFFRTLTGFRNQNYSFLDDLVTLDKDLYKNLNFIKVNIMLLN